MPRGTGRATNPLTGQTDSGGGHTASTEDEARRQAEALADAMGITFYVVRNGAGDFSPVQQPADGCEIIASVAPPASVHEAPHFDRE